MVANLRLVTRRVRQQVEFIPHIVPRSSNGRTIGSGPIYLGSNPSLGTLRGSPIYIGSNPSLRTLVISTL